ncbi:premnaspirodiene oxygenase [Phtheirospermum japonicum]|uniref:Premnaspirodiene oxygenase n=1 Tax=Phtheirospermum japonicum TaxID=374723 RepID=A0A830CMX8_9LAMI|nr:premnaspirodiene oxygenase [Phtheirospermum japonicum]
MEFDFSLLSVVSFFVFVLVLLKLGAHPKTKKPKLNRPPGPRKLPFIGNLHLFAASRHHPLQQTLRDLAKKYGPLMHLRLGEIDTIVVSSPETAKLIMRTHDITFASRPPLLLADDSSFGSKSIALAPYGEYWRQMRKICSLELLTTKRVLSFRTIREEEVLDLCKWIALHQGQKINLTERISSVNNDTMVRASVGKKIAEKVKFIATISEAVEFLSIFRIADAYPSIKFLPVISGVRRKIDGLQRQLDKMMASIVEERIRDNINNNNISNNVGENKQEDLLDVLLNIQSDESLEVPLTCNNIKFILAEMFSAGTTTSTTIVDWAMAEMLKNPEILKKAQDEVRRVFDGKGGTGRVDESRFDELKYLRIVIKETLRMHPAAPLLVPRASRERCEINGYEIPAKTWVLFNAWAIGRDPEYWEDAERFKPERFLEKQEVDFKGNNFEYIPFGAGRRICPGLLFGVANVEIQLAMLLYHFDWVLADGMKAVEMDMTYICGVEGKRKHTLSVIPVVKRPLSV